MLKKILFKYFESFAYFYSYLRYRIFIVLGFSLFIGILDGFGLSMFLPLLKMVGDSSETNSEDLGKLGFLVDYINDIGLPFTLFTVLALMAIFFISKGVVQYMGGIYKVNVQEWFMRNIRIQNIRGLNSLTYKYFVNSDIGRIQNTLTGEVDRMIASYFNYFKALEYGILVTVYMGFAFWIDAQFAFLVTIGGILTNFLYTGLYKNTRGVSRTLTGENNVFQSLIIQNVSNYKYLKATGSSGKYSKKLEESVNRIKTSNTRIGKLDALLTAGREPILIAVVVSVIYLQTAFFGSDLGPIILSLVFFYRALSYLMQMQTRWNKFLAVSGSLENMTLFEKELKANREEEGEETIVGPINNIELSRVNFSYDDIQVLKEIDLKINKNETIAFVGESGSGKTTLVNLISGLLPVQNGHLKINDTFSKNLDVKSLQTKIGYITQDPVIFNDTVFNNVTFWAERTEASLERFWKAVRQSAVFDFVISQPDKEDAILGNNGVNLSGGQRQRISIARELFKEVEILILDEATSALDSETEKAIQQNIDELKGKYTILIVAHRISTIKNADKIVVMKNGKISHINSFSSLIEESPYFKRLVKLQEI